MNLITIDQYTINLDRIAYVRAESADLINVFVGGCDPIVLEGTSAKQFMEALALRESAVPS